MLDGKTFICKGWEPGKGAVEKTVKVTGTLDGPANDPRDYCTVIGFQKWENHMAIEDFAKTIIAEVE